MPRLVHATPKYRRHKASGQAVVTIAGRDHYLGPYGSKASKVEYDRLILEWLASSRQPATAKPEPDLTITELVARYWRFAQRYYRKNGEPTKTLDGVRGSLRYLRRAFGPTIAAEFGPLRLKAVREEMIRAGLSRSYINGSVGRIKRVFKWGVSEELLPASVYQALASVQGLAKGRSAARESEPVGPVPDAVVDATLPYLPPVVADMVRFHRLVGCRPGEVCLIRPCDIDRSNEVWCYRPESHKTEHHGRERRVYIGPKAQDVLLPYLLRHPESYCFSPKESRRKQLAQMRAHRKAKVQPSQVDRSKRNPKRAPGDRYSKDSYNSAIRRAVDRANRERAEGDKLPYWHPNQMRHSVATTVRRQYGIEASQVVLGHSNADVTQVYAERDFGLARDIMKRIG